MKPHMAHINNTMIRKQLVEKAKESPYDNYKKKVDEALSLGFPKDKIIIELENEIQRIKKDIRAGDSLHMQGVLNAQNACMDAIYVLITELANA